jgi:hypothetical protein
MSTKVFDPNTPIPFGLSDAAYDDKELTELPEPDAEIDVQTETTNDDDSQINEDEVDDELGVPGYFEIVEQVVRTGPDGSQVVDIVIEIEDVPEAEDYQVRVTKT